MSADIRTAIADLLAEHAARIDEDRLEDWLGLFAEDCLYRVTTRENVRLGLPLSLILCEGKAMLRDRVAALRKANIFNIHSDRHLVSAIRYRGQRDGLHHVEANYAVFQTSQEGESRLFSVGAYHDAIRETDGGLVFVQKLVIPDTAAIPTLLATPL